MCVELDFCYSTPVIDIYYGHFQVIYAPYVQVQSSGPSVQVLTEVDDPCMILHNDSVSYKLAVIMVSAF